MVPDTVEYGQWKTGIRTDGFIYAATSFMMKFGGAVGPAVLGLTLDKSGYVPLAEQSQSTLNMINLSMNFIPTLLAIVGIILFVFYKLDDKLHNKILVELREREG